MTPTTTANKTPASDLTELANRINLEHAAVGRALSDGLAHAIQAGELLHAAKQNIDHGAWLPWLKANCPAISERTAQAYMRVAREYPKVAAADPQRVADLSFRQAVKLLAEPAGSDECEWPVTLPKFIPSPAHALTGELGDETIHIFPSSMAGFFYVNRMSSFPSWSGQPLEETNAVIEGTVKPVRQDAIETVLSLIYRDYRGIKEWESYPCMPLTHNVFLTSESS